MSDELQLTGADYEAADKALANLSPAPEAHDDTRSRLATLHHLIVNFGSCAASVSVTRDHIKVAHLVGLISRAECGRKLRVLLQVNLTEEVLDARFNELQAEVETYCGLMRLCSDTLQRAGWFYEIAIERDIDAFIKQLSKKSQFDSEELQYLSDFIIEARIHRDAGAVELKSEMAGCYADLVMLVVGKLTQVWRERINDAHRSSVMGFCKACIDVLPRPQDLSAMLSQEQVLARLYLREQQKAAASKTAEPLAAAGSPDRVVAEENTSPSSAGSKISKEGQLTIGHWSELAIGVDEHGYWALTPRPEFGERFHKGRAKRLRLKSLRWKTLLERLADSADGETVSRQQLIMDWGLLPTDILDLARNLDDVDPDEREKLSSMSGTTLTSLNRVLTEMRERLRELISGPKGTADTCLETEGDFVKARFRVAYILANDDGGYRFGDRRPAS